MSASFPDETIAFIGAGNLAGALIRGLVRSGVPASRIRAASPSGPSASLRELGLGWAGTDNAAAAAGASVVVLCVKPHLAEAALASARSGVDDGALLLSCVAGVSCATLQAWLGAYRLRPIVRAMPNTPCAVGAGAAALAPGDLARPEHAERAARLLRAVCGAVHVVTERQLDAVTGLSGSGPAFVCLFIEALADGGVAAGLPRAVALSLAAQLVKGTAVLVQDTATHPAVLKDAVASPGGTTIAGIHALETAGFRGATMSAVLAAAKRATELAAQNCAAPAAGSSQR